MYKLLLISKYLRRKLVPMFAALAVTLCTAMVIIVISVMGGFLKQMRHSAHQLSGDVSIHGDLTGFPYYEEVLAKVREMPEVATATPIVRTFGLVRLRGQILTTEITGIVPDQLDRVTGFRDSLYWTADRVSSELERQIPAPDILSPEQTDLFAGYRQYWTERDLVAEAMQMQTASRAYQSVDAAGTMPAAVLGIAVSPTSFRDSDGQYRFSSSPVNTHENITITVLPLSKSGAFLEPATADLAVVNEFKSGLYELDANRIYVPFDLLQKKLGMEPRTQAVYDPETGEPTGRTVEVAGQASEIVIRGNDGIDAARLADAVAGQMRELMRAYPELPALRVLTWEEKHAGLLGAVEKEKGLLVLLFGIISLVAVAMIAVIFYMIVLEKTRDIGVLRAVGASRSGITSVFLGYGLAIGIVGALLGLAIGANIVWNLNEIQDQLYAWFGFRMWDPAVYYFDRIPSQIDQFEVTVIMIAAVLSSVIGSLIPAVLAGLQDPVEALRYE